jgi:hypothetical protein
VTRRRPLGFAALLLAGVMSACAPIVAPVAEPGQPGAAIGPQLVVAAENRSDREVTVAYEFEAQNASGGGESLLPRCDYQEVLFGEVAGSYEVLLEGTRALDGTVPPGMPADGFLMVRLSIDADGEVTPQGETGWTRIPPPLTNRPLADCG